MKQATSEDYKELYHALSTYYTMAPLMYSGNMNMPMMYNGSVEGIIEQVQEVLEKARGLLYEDE